MIASTLGNNFKEERIEVAKQYAFENWRHLGNGGIDFSSLSSEWIQMGFKMVKMMSTDAVFTLNYIKFELFYKSKPKTIKNFL